jgi:hypothetical protein
VGKINAEEAVINRGCMGRGGGEYWPVMKGVKNDSQRVREGIYDFSD